MGNVFEVFIKYGPENRIGIGQCREKGHAGPEFEIVVEYETDTPNRWVPFPITFGKLSTLFAHLGYGAVTKVNERPSSFGGTMYAALIRSKA